MARTLTRTAAACTLLAALPALAACALPEASTAGAFQTLPSLGRFPSRMRPPSSERPVWLNPPPEVAPRLPAPDFGFRA